MTRDEQLAALIDVMEEALAFINRIEDTEGETQPYQMAFDKTNPLHQLWLDNKPAARRLNTEDEDTDA